MKKLYKAIGCNGNGEWAEFSKVLDEDDHDSDLDFKDEVEALGFSLVCLYRASDVIIKAKLAS